MAHVAKYSKGSCRAILAHNERSKSEDKAYKNKDIDVSRTHLNYSFLDVDNTTAEERLEQRLKEVKVQNRADVNILASWIVTLPNDVKKEDSRKFFAACFDFLSDKYGKENVISACVHNDESTPHLHFAFVPTVRNTSKSKKFALKVSAKECLNRSSLLTFHSELDNYIAEKLGYQVGIRTGNTNVNYSINELKKQTEQTCDRRRKETSQECYDRIKALEKNTELAYERLAALDNAASKIDSVYPRVNDTDIKLRKKFFSNEEKVEVPREHYDSLVRYAENAEALSIKIEQHHEAIKEYKKLVADSDLQKEIEHLKKENKELRVEIEYLKSFKICVQKIKSEVFDFAEIIANKYKEYMRKFDFSRSPETFVNSELNSISHSRRSR